jgi:hypothetical protein
MGMGSFAVGSFVIEYKDLKKICPDEIKAIEKAKYFKNIGWYNIGRWLAWDNPEEVIEPIYECVNDDETATEQIFEQYESLIQSLKDTFNKKTGLTLYFDTYDEEGGGRYDNPGDKDGCIFCVDGMVQLTPAGEKFKDIISERKWTQYG